MRRRDTHRLDSVPIEYTGRVATSIQALKRHLGYAPLDSWMVEAAGSMPASMPLYRTSEWDMSEIGFLWQTSVSHGEVPVELECVPDKAEGHAVCLT